MMNLESPEFDNEAIFINAGTNPGAGKDVNPLASAGRRRTGNRIPAPDQWGDCDMD